MPSDDEIREGEQVLAQFPEYRWLTSSGLQWWTVSEVADHLGVGKDVVRGWCERQEIPGAVLYGQQIGWRMPRSGLIVYCARKQGWNGEQHSAG